MKPSKYYRTILSLLFLSLTSISALNQRIPVLSIHEPLTLKNPNQALSTSKASDTNAFKTYYYNQTLDHFNYAPNSYTTFQQRYLVDDTHWNGSNATGSNSTAPIFAYFGGEAPIDNDLHVVGFLKENAPRFNALSVFIEHRFYGKSTPYSGSMEEAMRDPVLRGYFSSAQALADYAEVLLHVKEKFSAQKSPIIVIGGSYAGMLASWFRLKYPQIAYGALASSAPILYFDDVTPQDGYYSVVTKDYKDVSKNCAETIQKSWSQIDEVASRPNGLEILSGTFNTCTPLNRSSELKGYLHSVFVHAAQYNSPPNYPVTTLCNGIDNAPEGADILGRILAGLVSYRGNQTCSQTKDGSHPSETTIGWEWQASYNSYPSETTLGWEWQTCSEMVMPIGRAENDTMFPLAPFDLDRFIERCKKTYGVLPRPHWITTYYGGRDFKLNLDRFASNIIFSNGLQDPYSSAGVLEDISDSVVAVTTRNGSHCLDVVNSRDSDPQWLIDQRNIEVKIIEGWLSKYNSNFKPST